MKYFWALLISLFFVVPLWTGANPTFFQFAALLGKSPSLPASTIVGPANAPSDGLAVAYMYVIPRVAGVLLGAGKTVEITVSSANVTLAGGSGACRTPAATCVKATDQGNGNYTFNAKSSTVGTYTFTIAVAGTPDIAITPSPSITFNTANFTTISANTTITSATHGGKNLYFTGGTATFDPTTVGVTFGDLFVRGGTLNHTTSTTTVYYKIDINASSLTMQSGSINVNNLGYRAGYSYSSTGTSTALTAKASINGYSTSCSNTYYINYYAGGSHGGRGANSSSAAYGPTYGDYRNPALPGAGGSSAGAGGGVVRFTSAGACTIMSGATINANAQTGSTMNPAGGSVYLNCGVFGGTAAANAITANGAVANLFTSSPCATYTSYYYSAAGGGGRIALISTGDTTAFTGSFAYPTGSTALTNFKSVINAFGGARVGTNASLDGGGAGTIYVKHSGLSNGDLIIDNNNQVLSGAYAGVTALVSSTANSNTVYANSGTNTLQITSASTPFNNMTNLFANYLIHVFSTSASADPYNAGHISVTLGSNDTNNLVATTSPFPTITNNYYYRFVYQLDHLDIGGYAQVDMSGADLMLASPSSSACDLHSATLGAFDIPTNAKLTGNSFGAATCLDAQVTTKTSTVNFTNYFLH